jgi:hypothetical protein
MWVAGGLGGGGGKSPPRRGRSPRRGRRASFSSHGGEEMALVLTLEGSWSLARGVASVDLPQE